MALIVNDNFTRANANPIGGIYGTVAGNGAVQVLSDAAFGTSANGFSGVADTTNSYPNDQYAVITCGLTLGFLYNYVTVRCSNTTSSPSEAEFVIGNGSTAASLIIRVASTPTTVATPTLNTVPTAGDTYQLSVIGQLYSMYQNGALVGTYTDGSVRLTSGSCGFWIESETPATGGNSITLFQSGSIVRASSFFLASSVAPLAWIIRRRQKLAQENRRRAWALSSGGIVVPDGKIAKAA